MLADSRLLCIRFQDLNAFNSELITIFSLFYIILVNDCTVYVNLSCDYNSFAGEKCQALINCEVDW